VPNTFNPTVPGLISFPSSNFYNTIVKNNPGLLKSLGADKDLLKTVVDSIAGQQLPNAGQQNPDPMQYVYAMSNYLNDAANKAGAKNPGAIRDAIMDATFAGIKNFEWRSLYDQPKSTSYRTAHGLLNQFWRDVQSAGLESFDRSKFGGGMDVSGAKGVMAVINGLNTYMNTTAKAGEKSTAANRIDDMLDQWGLPGLKQFANDLVWKKGIVNASDLADQIRATEQYKNRFKGMIDHNKNYPLKIDEGTYLSTENQMIQVAEQYLPAGVFTRQKAAELIAGGVSPMRFQERIAKGYAAAAAADPATKKYLVNMGLTPKDIALYFLDPKNTEPFLQQQVAKATLRGYADNIGLKDFTQSMADDLAERVRSSANNPYGTYTMDQARKAMEYAAQNRPLTGAAPGSNAPTVDTSQLIGSQIAGFQGTTQGEAAQEVKTATEAAASPFQSGGGYDTTQKGVTGLGSAPQ
jgi:hypothetical protein